MYITLILPLLLLLVTARPSSAQTTAAPSSDLERRVQALSDEVDQLKAQTAAANGGEAKSDRLSDKLEISGFAEMTYQNFDRHEQNGNAANQKDTANVERVCLDAIYNFTDKIKAMFEFEILNAGVYPTNNKGTFDIEQAWAQDKLWDQFGLRGGLVVVPLGLVNEHHRPTDYLTVFRPDVEQFIIPSTWREMGAGAFGDEGPVSYRTYILGGLSAVGSPDAANLQNTGFEGPTGLKGGRSLGSQSLVQSGAWAGRVDYNFMPKSFVGAAAYVGGANQTGSGVGDAPLAGAVPVSLWETHAKVDYKGIWFRALYAQGTIGNAGAINTAQSKSVTGWTTADSVGRSLFGGYGELGYNVFTLLPDRKDSLTPFIHYERYATADEVPTIAGISAFQPATSRVEETVGLNYKPVDHFVLKAEYQWLRNEARTGDNEWNLGMGWEF